ncbi:Clp protease N-terminal domain-containing protein [Nocardia sp. NPDC050406]|uniref:Clp protease N-terminal domain-containing protein n=1 Tax=Nocardia sp. NPDC050406 TaxID=3364318 RepID=UPI0037A19D01
MSNFDKYFHAVLTRAAEQAQAAGSTTIEAQHLLLAMAVRPEPETDRVLAAVGLDYEAIRAALDREFEQSLLAAGISRTDFALPAASPGVERPKQLGASAKLAVERSFTAVAKKDARPAHLLLGILRAEVGTVPRALALAGVDAAALRDRVQRALEGER